MNIYVKGIYNKQKLVKGITLVKSGGTGEEDEEERGSKIDGHHLREERVKRLSVHEQRSNGRIIRDRPITLWNGLIIILYYIVGEWQRAAVG